jgi:hypothetical protein
MRAWLQRAGLAARIAADHGELWLPGALAWVAFLGWLPFVLAVARAPGEGDVTVFGAALVTNGDWPANAIRLGFGLFAVALVANTLVAFGEAGLLRLLDGRLREASGSALFVAARRLWLVQLVAALPAVVALLALGAAAAGAAVGELQSPDIGGSAWMRIAARVAPFALVLLLALVGGQALAAAAGRRLAGNRAMRFRDGVVGALRDLAHRPAQRIGLAALSMAVQVIYLTLCLLLLKVLWAPIGAAFAEGRATTSAAPLLLVGFVAIWICLVLAGGALRAFVAAWWSLELAAGPMGESSAREEAAAT